MSAPRVSILVPTLNAERYLERLLPALAGQRVEGGLEVRVVDSDSRDCTRQILRRAAIPVDCIERAAFRHGATRNLLAQAARGELLVFLSQDALPAGEDFVAELVRPFADPAVAASMGRALPHPTDDPLTARSALAAPEGADEQLVRALPAGRTLDDLGGEERAALTRFHNVASCIRRSVLADIPFPDVPFGEDSAWAAAALGAGWKIAVAPEAVVYHAHRYSPGEAFERFRVDAAFQRRVHGHRVRPDLVSVVRGLLHELREDVRYVRRERAGWQHLLRAPRLRGAQVLGQYFGTHGWNPGGGGEATRKFA